MTSLHFLLWGWKAKLVSSFKNLVTMSNSADSIVTQAFLGGGSDVSCQFKTQRSEFECNARFLFTYIP